ncbi:hypothetical protein N781_07325 [Pontibacillus halophilus JSM 076056 = DSM 19796]|uniref:Rhodanese domain-containing protein n=1 Tax=Pontibacillus halophilus JSM 076056 = DSM 19796 TaxID=1385510 RepID=A0A0A5I0Z6_9BACI|nr:rhodanese-like domain-containing protein [Pontibacillus halophilus]KGX89497.1 hypothetical protein N781_07325 [Pontibacillus halophilus JSM 076056 = DSM 19796]
MKWIAFVLLIALLVKAVRDYLAPSLFVNEIEEGKIEQGDYCVIDVRDYISAHRTPYPSAENIPLAYLSRAIHDEWACDKDIVLISDDMRGVRKAVKLLPKKPNRRIYYRKALV